MAGTVYTAGAATAMPTMGAMAEAVGATCEADAPAAATVAETVMLLSASVVVIVLGLVIE